MYFKCFEFYFLIMADKYGKDFSMSAILLQIYEF